ncbi:MAG: hypothetical protein QNJ73_02525 [Gammaproteobacteria bacterium]|nr:hypothetical protein [Gammaproteobacteria bacterium]
MTVVFRLTALVCALVLASLVSAGQHAEEDAVSDFAEHMHGHLDEVGAMKAAVIAGDLDGVIEPATWLATHDEPSGMPEAWQPYIEEMRLYAARAANAQDLVTAASAVSEIGRSCGGCHQAMGFKVAFGMDERPPSDVQNLRTQMQRHLWAADRMWDGLIGPSDGAWRRGTDILTEVQLTAGDITEDPGKKGQVSALVVRARSLGEQGSLATSSELRSGLYGEFLSLCASCHSLTGGGPASR